MLIAVTACPVHFATFENLRHPDMFGGDESSPTSRTGSVMSIDDDDDDSSPKTSYPTNGALRTRLDTGHRSISPFLCGGLRPLELGFARGTHYFEGVPIPLRIRFCQPSTVPVTVAGVCPLGPRNGGGDLSSPESTPAYSGHVL